MKKVDLKALNVDYSLRRKQYPERCRNVEYINCHDPKSVIKGIIFYQYDDPQRPELSGPQIEIVYPKSPDVLSGDNEAFKISAAYKQSPGAAYIYRGWDSSENWNISAFGMYDYHNSGMRFYKPDFHEMSSRSESILDAKERETRAKLTTQAQEQIAKYKDENHWQHLSDEEVRTISLITGLRDHGLLSSRDAKLAVKRIGIVAELPPIKSLDIPQMSYNKYEVMRSHNPDGDTRRTFQYFWNKNPNLYARKYGDRYVITYTGDNLPREKIKQYFAKLTKDITEYYPDSEDQVVTYKISSVQINKPNEALRTALNELAARSGHQQSL